MKSEGSEQTGILNLTAQSKFFLIFLKKKKYFKRSRGVIILGPRNPRLGWATSILMTDIGEGLC